MYGTCTTIVMEDDGYTVSANVRRLSKLIL